MSRFLAALILVAFAWPAEAQRFRDRRNVPGDFDFYVLALSWSPTYCEREGGRRNSRQCETGRNPGFVVHGLWPQFERGFPSECGLANRTPTRLDMEKARAFPEEGLARYQWRKHGSCSGSSPGAYFEDVAEARAKVKIPDELQAPTRALSTSVIEIERAFVAANRGLRADMISVQCDRNVLREVRICFSRDLRGFATCPEVDRAGCRARDINVPASR